MTRSRDDAGHAGVAVDRATSVDPETAAAVARVSAHGESVARRELATALARMGSHGDPSDAQRAVLAAMTARIVGRVLPGPGAIRADDVDATAVSELFADED